MTARELHHFLLLDQEQQREAIRRMARQGWSETSIAHATRLSVEQIRRVLAEPAGSSADLHGAAMSASTGMTDRLSVKPTGGGY
jgi:hypothetical protein